MLLNQTWKSCVPICKIWFALSTGGFEAKFNQAEMISQSYSIESCPMVGWKYLRCTAKNFEHHRHVVLCVQRFYLYFPYIIMQLYANIWYVVVWIYSHKLGIRLCLHAGDVETDPIKRSFFVVFDIPWKGCQWLPSRPKILPVFWHRIVYIYI